LARYKIEFGLRSPPRAEIAIVITTEVDFDYDLNFGGCEDVGGEGNLNE
jgi:hypothetical protein